jgi:two-component system response regulator HydG
MKRILIVDDDRATLTVLSSILRSEGYSVDTAESGSEAILKTDKQFFNLVLLDIKLPDIEGIDVLSSIKETSPKIVKIVVSGCDNFEIFLAALNRGADAYLIKPVDPEELIRIINEKLLKQGTAGKTNREKIGGDREVEQNFV